MDLNERASRALTDGLQTTAAAIEVLPAAVASASTGLWQAMLAGHKVLTCGNGASAASAQYLASTLVNRYEMDRPALPAVALTTDAALLTGVANDHRFDEVFARQVQALGQPGDVLVAFTTSGRSPNITAAINAAHERELTVVLLNGRDGGPAADMLGAGDVELRVPSWSGARIHEVHVLAVNAISELIDLQLGGGEND